MASDVNPYEALWVVKESAYGTAMASPVAGTDSIYVRLAGPNRFTMRTKPKKRKIPFGGGYAVPGYAKADQYETAGDLTVELCYSQAKLLLDWACTRVNTAQTAPWVITEPPGDLASCSVYHAVMRYDGTIRRRLYQGAKVTAWSLAGGADNGMTPLKLSLRAQRAAGTDPTSTAFPLPADTAFPTDPLLFYHLSGLSIGGAGVSLCEQFGLDVTNGLDPHFYLSQFLTIDRLRGRQFKATATVPYTASPEWRTLFEAATSQAVTASWTNGTNTVAINYNANNLLDEAEDDLTPGQVYNQNLTWEGQWDPAAGADLGFTFT